MGRVKPDRPITCFTPSGDHFAAFSPDGVVKVWNTDSGKLLMEWKDPDIKVDGGYSCMACSSIGKKRKKDNGTLLLCLGTNLGDVLAINVFSNERKWTSMSRHPGGITGLLFSSKGCKLLVAGANGIVSEFDAETGELLSEMKASKKPITTLAISPDGKLLAVASRKIHIFSLKSKEELQNFSPDISLRHIAVADGGKVIISSGLGEKQLHIWNLDQSNRIENMRNILSMESVPLMLECYSGKEEEVNLVLSVSEKGVAYLWNLMSEEDMRPSKIKVKSVKAETGQEKSHKKVLFPVIAACLHKIAVDHVSVRIAYGSPACPQFSLVDVNSFGEDIYLTASDEVSTLVSINEGLDENGGSKPIGDKRQKKRDGKKRPAPEQSNNNVGSDISDEPHIQYDMNEPTMGEKLAALNLLEEGARSPEKQDHSLVLKPPSADSVEVLLKQSLHADDRALLLDCLYTQDEKVIDKSTSLLNPSDVLKLLSFLVSLLQSRGAILACTIPWLRSLLLQHASSIMSQGSCLLALNSMYQLVQSRTSTYKSALRLSSSIDYLLAGVPDGHTEEITFAPVIFEDNDDSNEEHLMDAMKTDESSGGEVEDPESVHVDEFDETSDDED